MIIFPLGTDRRLQRTPWVNYALIAANVGIFLFTERQIKAISSAVQQYYQHAIENIDRPDIRAFLDDNPLYQAYLQPETLQLSQFFTYQFLHADLLHLIGNMLFLFVFGNAVEDRLGKIGYLAFYLAGGVLAGLGHVYTSHAPVLGASGSVAAVTGAFLALFPLANITLGYWIIIVFDTFVVSAIVLILFRVAQDFIFNFSGIGGVAYMAHLAGYAYGFSAGMAVLMLRLVDREPYDMLTLLEQKRRRSQFKRLSQKDGYHPWDTARPGKGEAPPKPGDAGELTDEQRDLMERRAVISKAVAAHDLPGAAAAYAALLEQYPDQVMPQQTQLDLANQLMAEQKHAVAARAYELLLSKFHTYTDAAQVKLILGLIYARYLDEPGRARELLTEATPRLVGDERQLAEKVLSDLPENTS